MKKQNIPFVSIPVVCRAVICALIFAVSCPAYAGTVFVKSSITQVTLFSSKALVTRSGKAHVGAGITHLFIETDAFSINGDSASAAVYGNGTVMAVRVSRTPEPETPQDTIRKLEKKRDALLAEKAGLSSRKTAENKKAAFIDAVIESSKGKAVSDMTAGKTPETEALSSLLSFIGQNVAAIGKNTNEIEAEIQSIDAKIAAVEKEISMLSYKGNRNTSAIEIIFNAVNTQDIRIQTSYISPQAGWSPVYRADISASDNNFKLSLMARVIQKTGEDWKDVALTISNALFVPGGHLPEIASWYIDVPRARTVRRKYMMTAAPAAMAQAEDSVAKAAGFNQATARQTAVSKEYDISSPVTVRSRDEETLVPLFTKTVTGDFYRLCIPAESPHAYLTCRAKTDDDLEAGPMRIFFDGRYAGRMMLDEKQAGKPFVIGLGTDRSIRLKREKRIDQKKETFFKKFERDTVIRDLAYHITVENTGDRTVKLQVADHVPVSKTDRITVEDISFSPQPASKDADGKPGVMVWDMTAGPGETKTIDMSFTVSYPKDMPFYP